LIAATGVSELTAAVLACAKEIYETKGIAQKEIEQAVLDQQADAAALKAARESIRVFGKAGDEVDAIVANRRIDPSLVAPNPLSERAAPPAARC
jgi:cobalt-zinc-cadmium efflux system membrane fusion protein